MSLRDRAALAVSKVEGFGNFRPELQPPLRRRFVQGRYARLDIGKIGAWCMLADRQEMRFRRAFDECRKYRSRDRVARVHSSRLCRRFGGHDRQGCYGWMAAFAATISILWSPVCVSTDRETGAPPQVRNGLRRRCKPKTLRSGASVCNNHQPKNCPIDIREFDL